MISLVPNIFFFLLVIWASLNIGTWVKMRQNPQLSMSESCWNIVWCCIHCRIDGFPYFSSLFTWVVGKLPPHHPHPWPLNTYTKAPEASKWKDIYVPVLFWCFWVSRNIKRQDELKMEKFCGILSFNCFLTM